MTIHRVRRMAAVAAVVTAVAVALAGCGSGFNGPDDTKTAALTSSDKPLTILMGSSGEAETAAVEAAVAAWSKKSGVQAEVRVASALTQQLAQGFAASSPPDLFYLAPDAIAGYARNGSLKAYGDLLSNKADFYPSLVKNFTVDGQFYCAPKDFSTLALVVNADLWAAARLTKADVPTTWDELAKVSARLTRDGVVGLAFGAEYQRIGAFMAQAGGGLVSPDGAVIADHPENVRALDYVRQELTSGSFAYAPDLGAGWGGEAFGKKLAAMTIEGNWIGGALRNDFPDVNYFVAELPAGSAGKGTLQFTNCWGMAADSQNQKAALDLVEYLTTADQQLAFSKAFGPMPSVQSAAQAWKTDNPSLVAFLNGADYAHFLPTQTGVSAVITDFNSQLQSLKTGDPKSILDSVQANLQSVAGGK